MADQSGPKNSEPCPGGWFNVGLSDLGLAIERVFSSLSFMIGETDEYLPLPLPEPMTRAEAVPNLITVEDMIYVNAKRHWVKGGTYLEAEAAGLQDHDVIDLLYRDILGRPADPGGLANYLFQRQQGVRDFGDIRKSLLESEEYVRRSKRASEAPGAVFSQGLVMLAATSARQEDAHNGEPSQPPATALSGMDPAPETELQLRSQTVPTSGPWPDYNERLVEADDALVLDGDQNISKVEIDLPLDSVLFGTGWHNIEVHRRTGKDFRWMQARSFIFNPKPAIPCYSINLSVLGVYGGQEPTLKCLLDDVLAEVVLEKKEVGYVVRITPPGGFPIFYKRLEIESQKSGCPLQEKSGSDPRTLSVSISHVVIGYIKRMAPIATSG